MARIGGVDLPKNKNIFIALTYIYGIGKSQSQRVVNAVGVDPFKKVKDLTDQEVNDIRKFIEKEIKIEGDLRKEVSLSIKRLMDIGCYRGLRHRRGLPVRGQRTHTNARTRKGPRKGGVVKKKSAK
ncbi:MAG: 30S ribosomal protein S13 [Candidatus Schekmanbacteria bacterium]|nr:MAG: 30S ribosomal protein S13 [Candidatus Schekmanbacteria bacterium]